MIMGVHKWAACVSTVIALGMCLGGIAAAGEFDGTYAGTMKLVKDSSGKNRCPTDRQMTVTVQDGKFATSWRQQRGDVDLKPDGTFKSSVAGAELSGQIRAGQLESDISDGTCSYHWSLQRQP
jgi:hypothetical protein